MKKNRIGWVSLVLAFVSLVGLGVFFGSSIKNQFEQQSNELTNYYQIRAVPIPSQLSFAGEEVPINDFLIKERLDREFLVNTYWQSSTLMIFKRSKKFFEEMDPILKKYNVPEDFKYLAVIESGLVNNATSGSGAKGVWQFMPSTAKAYGLEVNDEVDERMHLAKSTEAACRYLVEAKSTLGNWTLAAAAYNRGSSGIQRDIDKQKVYDYYQLHLNSETARYVPRILAVKTIMQSPKKYGYMLEHKDYYDSDDFMLLEITESIDNIAEFALKMGTTYHQIKTLNPWLLGNSLTVKAKTYFLKIPRKSK